MDKFIKAINQWLSSSAEERLESINELYKVINVTAIILIVILLLFMLFLIRVRKNRDKMKKKLSGISEYSYLLTLRKEKSDILNQCIKRYEELNKGFIQELITQIVVRIIIISLGIYILSLEIYSLMYISLYCSLLVCVFMLFTFIIVDGFFLLYFKSFDSKGKKYDNNVSTLQEKMAQNGSYIYDMKLRSTYMERNKENVGIVKIVFYPNGNESEFYRSNNGTLQIKIKYSK